MVLASRVYWFLTTVGEPATFVTDTVPSAFVTTRMGTMTRPRVATDDVAVLDDDDGETTGVSVVRVVRGAPFAATFGLGTTADDNVGVSVVVPDVERLTIVVLAPLRAATFGLGTIPDDLVGERTVVAPDDVALDVVRFGPAANWPGVAVVAAVVGVTSVGLEPTAVPLTVAFAVVDAVPESETISP
jgi:hypothetical protein